MPSEPTIPITLLFWVLALAPVLVLLVLLVVLRWTAAQAGAVGYLTAAVLALTVFQTPVFTLGVATAKGFWDALLILYIVWTALLLYEIARAAGVFEAFREGVQRLTPNRLVQYLAFALVFVLFLQSTAGFGTPIAVAAPLLVGLGIQPVYAVALALIGHVWGNSFGGLAISWLAIELVVEVQQPTVALITSAILLAVAIVASSTTLAYLFGGWSAVRQGWLLLAVLIAIYGLGQLAIVPFVPELAALVPATVAVGVLYALSRLPRYQRDFRGKVRARMMRSQGSEESPAQPAQHEAGRLSRAHPPLLIAFAPYYALAGFAVLTLAASELIGPLRDITVGLPFPGVSTGYDVVRQATSAYSDFNPLGHPGTAILLAALTGLAIFIPRGHLQPQQLRGIAERVAGNAVPTSVAIVGFLTLSSVMEHSGQVYVLARGLAAVLPAVLYPAAAVLVGILGAFMTSSNTASNVIFAPLQSEVAARLGISQGVVLGAQMAGGAYGNAISPANVALGTSTTGISGKEGEVLRRTLPWTLGLGLCGALAAVGLALIAPAGR